MIDHDSHFIDGKWRKTTNADHTIVRDSATEDAVGKVSHGSADDVDAAVKAARAAFPSWSSLSVERRASFIRAIADQLEARLDELTSGITAEVGMPVKLTRRIQAQAPIAAWRATADAAVEAMSDAPLGHSIITKEAVGVVAAITPWNYPLHQITGKLAAALAAGCCVVLKPSELAPTAAKVLGEAIASAGLPAGVVNIVFGDGATGEALVTHAGVDMVSFTGSTKVGRHIASSAGQALKRVALELGGKSAGIALRDADPALVVKHALSSCLLNSGQTCSAITRLIVPEERYDDYRAALKAAAGKMRVGDPRDPDTRVGPLVSAEHKQRVAAFVVDAMEQKFDPIVVGDGTTPTTGFFVAPAIFGRVPIASRLAQEEVFGPVLPCRPMRPTKRRSKSPTARPTALRAPSGAARPNRLNPSRVGCARAKLTSMVRRSTRRRRSAVSAPPASAGKAAATGSRSSWNSGPSRYPPRPQAECERRTRMYKQLEITRAGTDDHVAVLWFNRPDNMNALTKVMEAELRDAFASLDRDETVRAIVLTGKGRAFCAGMDIAELETLPPGDIREAEWMRPYDMNRRSDYQSRYSYFPAVRKPVISAINGATAGLGLVFALYSDIRFASDKAVFSTAFAKRGLIAEHGIAWMLPRLVGPGAAADLLFSARKVTAQEALAMRLVERLVPADKLIEEAVAYADDLAVNVSPRSIRVIKQQLGEVPFQTLSDAIALANREMFDSIQSDDFKEGVAHFVERRQARFTGS